MLSTVFVHMLREVRESVDRAKALGMFSNEMEFPLAELLIGLGKIQTSVLIFCFVSRIFQYILLFSIFFRIYFGPTS